MKLQFKHQKCRADEAFLRVGDKSKLQTFEDRLQLSYDKGERYFEDKAGIMQIKGNALRNRLCPYAITFLILC